MGVQTAFVRRLVGGSTRSHLPAPPDILLAVMAFATIWAVGSDEAGQVPWPRDIWLVGGYALASIPFAWRRCWPVAAYLVSLATTTTIWLLGHDASVLPMLLLVGAYWVAASRTRAETVVVAMASVAAFSVLWWRSGTTYGAGEFVASTAGLVTSLALGGGARLREEVADQKARLAQESARHRISEERLRVARELHDILGHSLTTIAVQAGVGSHLIRVDPVQAEAALENIAQVSRAALGEVRQVVTALRETGRDVNRGTRLARIEDLVALARMGGLRVDLDLPTHDEPLPTDVEEASFAIVREALTNVMRHAVQPTRAVITVARRDALMDIHIFDDGRPGRPEESTTGHGLMGMRERAASLGGAVTAGPSPGGGYLVHAELPIGG